MITNEQRKLLTGLEKIEPLKLNFWNVDMLTADIAISDKLNEVIEAVNLLIELNKGVK